ncbi:Bax inhibitor-1/YccA family protein [Haliangium sp.]|uniref:Bax inhibitor-1/YccA family protein n=1 Tax=Haliangium sp. TaxID=2663208 RepID=UPI003D1029F8
MQQAYARPIPGAVATAGVNERVAFLRKTYAHLGGAIGLFVLLEAMFLNSSAGESFAMWAFSGRWNWLMVLGLFMVVGWVGERWASSDVSRNMQYLGLAVYVVAEVIVTAPLLYIAQSFFPEEPVIQTAALITLLLFAGLTATVFITKKDFSFLRGILMMGTLVAFGLILASIFFGFSLGLVFIVAMIGLAAGYVLYYTSRVLAYYPPTHYVAASLALFSAIALLFWYVLQLVMSLSRD